MKSLSVTIQVKATKQYFPVVVFIMLYKVVLTFESVDEILKFDPWNESYWAVHSGHIFFFTIFMKKKYFGVYTNFQDTERFKWLPIYLLK